MDECPTRKLFPVEEITSELETIYQEGCCAREAGTADFLNPHWPDEAEFPRDADPLTRERMNAWWLGWHDHDLGLFVVNAEWMEQADVIINLHYDNLDRTDLMAIGEGICTTQHTSGLPAEMAFTILEEQNKFSPVEKALIMSWYLRASFHHKRDSGTSYRRLRQIHIIHRELPIEVLKTGKFRSVYHKLL